MKVLLFATLLCAFQLAAADVAKLQAYYDYLRTRDATVFAAAAVTQDASKVFAGATIAMGSQDFISSLPMWLDSGVRTNSASDVLVTAAALRLINGGVLPALTAPIPSAFLPRGVTNFYNPAYTSIPITIEMLLRHTSSITDAAFDTFRAVAPPSTVTDIIAFCEAYFVTASGTAPTITYSASAAIWSTSRPGDSSAYTYARANVALLSYVINAAVLSQPALVTSATKDVTSYLQEHIIGSVGMPGTFRLSTDGGFPTTSLPVGGPLYANQVVKDLSASGTAKTQRFIHPAHLADYMFYSTASDYARLMSALFLNSNSALSSIGSTMKSAKITVGAPLTGQSGQSYGVMHFDGAQICAAALASSVISRCPLTSTSTIWGTYAVGYHGMFGVFCTAVTTSQSACVTAHLSYYESTPSSKSVAMLLGLAGVAFQEAIGSEATQQASTAKTQDGLLGLWVTLGVCMIIVFVLAAAYFTEYVVQPAPFAAGVSAQPPPIPPTYMPTTVPQGDIAGFYAD